MNTKTKELFAQALDTTVPETWTTLTPQQLAKFVDKFAELLIDEVYSFLLNPSLDDEPWPSRKETRQHFGVEQ
jgi:late competence protein required for DNA uptake (superfamily II DNA/RNA helicase)